MGIIRPANAGSEVAVLSLWAHLRIYPLSLLSCPIFRVTINPFEGRTMLRMPPLAAGAFAVIAARKIGLTDAVERDLPAQAEPGMSHDLALAQNHALDLARILMTPVSLFEVDGEYGVMPSAELDDAEVEILFEYDPFEVRSKR